MKPLERLRARAGDLERRHDLPFPRCVHALRCMNRSERGDLVISPGE